MFAPESLSVSGKSSSLIKYKPSVVYLSIGLGCQAVILPVTSKAAASENIVSIILPANLLVNETLNFLTSFVKLCNTSDFY